MRIMNIGWKVKGFSSFVKLSQKFNLSPEAEYRLKVIGYYFNKFNEDATTSPVSSSKPAIPPPTPAKT